MSKQNIAGIKVLSLYLLLILTCFTGCQEVVDIDVDDFEQKLVIDGSITDTHEKNFVKLYYPENAFKPSSIQNVSGAKVTLSDNTGNSEILKESEPGLYLISSITGVPGRTYTLHVENSGKIYTGISILQQPMEFDEIKFEKYSSTALGVTLYEYYKIKFYLTNLRGSDEYCMIKISDNSSLNYISATIYREQYADGRQFVIDNISRRFNKNTVVTVELLSIDKTSYEYFRQLNELAGEGDITVSDILSMNSFNPKSNLSNGALGCFCAYSYKKYTVTAK